MVKNIPELDAVSDEILVRAAKNGDSKAFEVLASRFRVGINARARTYFLRGADKEDIIQEGMIGLVKAIRDYKPDKRTGFKAFAELCITRQIITAIKTATRQKHLPLNSYVSLYNKENGDDDGRMLIDTLECDYSSNPEEYMIIAESYKGIDEKILKILSKFEKKVLEHYMEGLSYGEIAEKLNCPIKSIDNALQRIKHKLENSKDMLE